MCSRLSKSEKLTRRIWCYPYRAYPYIHQPTNTNNEIQYNTSHNVQFMTSIELSTHSVTGVPSNVHLRFKRLLFGGCTSGSMRGFGCESRAVRWVAVRSRKTVRTCGMCRSEWRVWLETFHGAWVIDLRSLDWYRWMTAMLDLVAHHRSSIPYVHTGFTTVL